MTEAIANDFLILLNLKKKLIAALVNYPFFHFDFFSKLIFMLGNKINRSVSADRKDGGTSTYSRQLWKVIPINKPYNTNSKPSSIEKPQGFVTWKKFDQKFTGNKSRCLVSVQQHSGPFISLSIFFWRSHCVVFVMPANLFINCNFNCVQRYLA